MNKQIVKMWNSTYSLLFTPKIFFKNKKADDLKVALPYFLASIIIGIIASFFHSTPSLSSFISYAISLTCSYLLYFLTTTAFIYIIIRLLGEKISYKNIVTTLMFVSFISIIGQMYLCIYVIFGRIITLDVLLYSYCFIISRSILFIWESYCAIIGLSIMQQMDRKVAAIGILSVFSFFYLWRLLWPISIILAYQ